ncbi:MAG: GTP-binding protein, partial [Anaerosomatales bacterium]
MAPSLVLGTAGHIDHGKSTLVKALTGTDPDRLAEEKARGITIELGFAQLTLPSGRTMGVVDVPGHERFVRHMVAGATGIDAVLLVVAADDGIMPQTREHLAIIDLLGIERGVVALTKADLAEPDWMELVAEEVRELVDTTSIAGAPVVP